MEEEPPLDEKEVVDFDVERASHSADQLDRTIQVTTRKSWIALTVCIAICLLGLLWSIFGSIPIKVIGRGIVINEEGLFNVEAQSDGIARKILVTSHDHVNKGQLVAEIYEPQMALKLEEAEKRVTFLQQQYSLLQQQVAQEMQANKDALEREVSSKQFTIKSLNDEIELYKSDLEKKTKLNREGLIPLNQVLQARQQLNEKMITLETTHASLAQTEANLKKSYRYDELKSRENELLLAIQERDLLLLSEKYTLVYSPYDGEVLGLLVNVGEQVKRGTPLIWFEHVSDKQRAHLIYGYLPVEEGKRVPVGTPVQIELSTVNMQEYGALLGKVINVSQFAVSPEALTKKIHNAGLVQYLTAGNEAVIEIVVQPDLDLNTFSGYRWSSGDGPQITISTGTVGTIKAIIERIRPLYYIFPIWRLKNIENSLQASSL